MTYRVSLHPSAESLKRSSSAQTHLIERLPPTTSADERSPFIFCRPLLRYAFESLVQSYAPSLREDLQGIDMYSGAVQSRL